MKEYAKLVQTLIAAQGCLSAAFMTLTLLLSPIAVRIGSDEFWSGFFLWLGISLFVGCLWVLLSVEWGNPRFENRKKLALVVGWLSVPLMLWASYEMSGRRDFAEGFQVVALGAGLPILLFTYLSFQLFGRTPSNNE